LPHAGKGWNVGFDTLDEISVNIDQLLEIWGELHIKFIIQTNLSMTGRSTRSSI